MTNYLKDQCALVLLYCAVLLSFISIPSEIFAQSASPEYVHLQSGLSFKQVGNGTYRRFGFRVYQATLWATSNRWEPQSPFLLELHYVRNVSKDTLVESIIDDMREQNVADEQELGKWAETLSGILTDVNEGDTLSGLSVPGAKTKIFMNSREIATLDEESLSHAFFNMWFGEQADPDLRKELLGRS